MCATLGGAMNRVLPLRRHEHLCLPCARNKRPRRPLGHLSDLVDTTHQVVRDHAPATWLGKDPHAQSSIPHSASLLKRECMRRVHVLVVVIVCITNLYNSSRSCHVEFTHHLHMMPRFASHTLLTCGSNVCYELVWQSLRNLHEFI